MGDKLEDYPHGQVTYLFTDLVESTQLWELFPDAMHTAMSRYDALLRQAIDDYQGRVVKTTGDGIHAAFNSPLDVNWLRRSDLIICCGSCTVEKQFNLTISDD